MVAGKPFSWNFPGAYPVIFAVSVAVSMATYNSIRNIARNPDVRLNKVLKNDEMAAERGLIDRAKAYYPSFFRWVGEARTIEKGGAAGSDCRVFRV